MTGPTGDTAPLSPEGGAVASREPEATPVVLRATVAYDGTSFRGFAQNQGVRTVAGDPLMQRAECSACRSPSPSQDAPTRGCTP